MARGPDRTDIVVRALESRLQRAVTLNQRMQFTLRRALEAVQRRRGDIRTAADLRREKDITQGVLATIEKVLAGDEPEAVPQPTPRPAAARANQQVPEEYSPRVGSGAYGILLALAGAQGDMSKHEIVRAVDNAGTCNQGLAAEDGNGIAPWKGNDTLLKHGLIERDRNSRQFINGRWGGGGCDAFRITAKGRQVAEKLQQDRGLNGGATLDGGHRGGAGGGGDGGGGGPQCGCGRPAQFSHWKVIYPTETHCFDPTLASAGRYIPVLLCLQVQAQGPL